MVWNGEKTVRTSWGNFGNSSGFDTHDFESNKYNRNITRGGFDGHLKMLGGCLEFFMKLDLSSTYLGLKRELDELIQNKLLNPRMDIQTSEELLAAVRLLITEDPCSGGFVFGRRGFPPRKTKSMLQTNSGGGGGGGDNSKSQLQTLLTRAGHDNPVYNTKPTKNHQFRDTVEFNGMQFVVQPCSNKKLAEMDVASEALEWLMGGNTTLS